MMGQYGYMTAVPPELVALGNGLGEYFREHHAEFKKGAKIEVVVDFDEFIDVQAYIEIDPVLAVRLRLDHKGEWQVLDYYNPCVKLV